MHGVTNVELWMVIPFAIMLLTIAIAPLVAEHFWEKNRNKLIYTAVISVVTVALLSSFGLGGAIVHNILYDYIPFVMLLLALFVVTGGSPPKRPWILSLLAFSWVSLVELLLGSPSTKRSDIIRYTMSAVVNP